MRQLRARREGRQWTVADIPDLTGARAVVTGANSGIGRFTALGLARHGADVVLGCRDAKRGAEAVTAIRQDVPDAAVRVEVLDLGDLASVRRFAGVLTGDAGTGGDGPGGPERDGPRLDLLVNNAGVMAIPRRVTIDGFETQLAVNHLGHFALTGLLLPLLLRGRMVGGPARVVTVSSGAHHRGRIDRDDLMAERDYGRWAAYSRSKLANLLFALELQRRADAAGAPLTSLAAHPGWAATNLQGVGPRMAGSTLQERLAGVGNRIFAQPAAAGAEPSLRAATDPEARPGEYFGPDGIGELRGHPQRVGRSARSLDTGTARWLWERSEQLTGVHYAFDEG